MDLFIWHLSGTTPYQMYLSQTWGLPGLFLFTMLTISRQVVGLRLKGFLILNRVHKLEKETGLTVHLGIIDMRFYFLQLQIFFCRKDDFPAQKSLEKQTTVLLKFVDYEIAIVFAHLDTVLKWNTSMNTCFVLFQYLCPQNLIHRHVYNTIWMWNNTSKPKQWIVLWMISFPRGEAESVRLKGRDQFYEICGNHVPLWASIMCKHHAAAAMVIQLPHSNTSS